MRSDRPDSGAGLGLESVVLQGVELKDTEPRRRTAGLRGARSTTGVGVSAASLAMPRFLPAQRADVYTRSTSSSYIDSASAGPALIAAVAQYFRWFRISSRPTERNASCTDEIWVMMSAQ